MTGSGSADPEDIREGVERARKVSGLPVCVGFGVRTGEQAAAMAAIADGVVVGSAFVDHVRLALEAGEPDAIAPRIGTLAAELSGALRSAE